MLRSATSFLLIITLLASGFSRYVIYAGFEANQGYIAAKLCENKDKPKLHCAGKCYLKKKIKQEEEKETNGNEQSQKNRFQEALITQKLKLSYPPGFVITTTARELPFDLPQRSASVFHPPKALFS